MRIELGLCSSALALVLMATAAWGESRLSGAQIDAHVNGNTLTITAVSPPDIIAIRWFCIER